MTAPDHMLEDTNGTCMKRGIHTWSLREMGAVRLPLGLGIERDVLFTGDFPISVWAEAARQAGSIRAAERILYARSASDGVPDRKTADTENRRT